MTFNEWCDAEGVTPAEREALIAHLITIRVSGMLADLNRKQKP